jgi:hypothetical protein
MRSLAMLPKWWDEPREDAVGPDTAKSFHKKTVCPLYETLKKGTKKSQKYEGGFLGMLGVCHRSGETKMRANSERVNYDDANEYFWNRACLKKTWHSDDDENGCHTIKFTKTFREKSSYIALYLSFWRYVLRALATLHCIQQESSHHNVQNHSVLSGGVPNAVSIGSSHRARRWHGRERHRFD